MSNELCHYVIKIMAVVSLTDLVIVLGILEGSTSRDVHLHDGRRAQVVDQHGNLTAGR